MVAGHDIGQALAEIKRKLGGGITEDDRFPSGKREGRAALLKDMRKVFSLPEKPFKPGDIVEWKVGMRFGRYPAYGEPAIVMNVMTEAEWNKKKDGAFIDPASPAFEQQHTMAVGVVTPGDEVFTIYHVDPRRMMRCALDPNVHIGDEEE